MAKSGTWLLVLLDVITLTPPASSFFIGRPIELPIVWNPVPWSLPASLEVPLNNSKDEATQPAGPENILQVIETSSLSQRSAVETKRDRGPGTLENHTKPVDAIRIADVGSLDAEPATAISGQPRNIVLLLIADDSSEDAWKDVAASHSFSVEGFLQTCPATDSESTRALSNDTAIVINKDKRCDCEDALRAGISSLLSYARNDRDMAVGSVSTENFTLPSALHYGKPIPRESRESGKTEVRRINKHRRLIEFLKPSRVSSLAVESSEDEATYGDPWDVFELLSRIKLGLFRALLNSVIGPPRASQANLTELLASTVRKLKSVGNGKGYVLVGVVPEVELVPAVKLLRAEVSRRTLLVAARLCFKDGKPVPFLAEGPAAEVLKNAGVVSNLPSVLKSTISGGCHGQGCAIRRRDVPALSVPGETSQGTATRNGNGMIRDEQKPDKLEEPKGNETTKGHSPSSSPDAA